MTSLRTKFLLSLALASVLFPACSRPNADEHFRKANELADAARLQDAIIEYRAALLVDPKRADIRLKLSDTYIRVGQLRGALDETIRAADLLPNDAAVQIRAGNMLLLARAFEDAKSRAKKALALDPKSVQGLILMGNALVGLKDIDGAMKDFQEAIALAPDRDSAYANLGTMQMISGQPAAAEASFRKAVEVAPKSVQARLALAYFFWASGRAAEAEQTLKDTLTVEPGNVTANRILGMFYVSSNRIKEAEPYFKAIAAINSTEAILTLADYYVLAQRLDEARKTFASLATKDEAYAVATTRLAALDAWEGQRAQALKRLQEVLEKHPNEIPARLLSAQLLLAEGKREEAAAQANSIVRDAPASRAAGEAYVVIGTVHAATDHPEDAIKAYEEALKLQAVPIVPAVALASLYLTAGSVDKAATYAQQALTLQPKNPQARAMTVRVLLAQGKAAKARDMLDSLRTDLPNSWTILNLVASEQLANRQVEAARATYAKAAALAPNNLEALAGLVQVDLASGRPKEAVSRIEAGLKLSNVTADFLVLAAKTYGAVGDLAKAEAVLRRAIEVAPAQLAAYSLLGSLYVIQHRLDEGQKEFQELVRRNPKSIPMNTMLGMLLEMQQRLPEAEKQYQNVLALDARAAVAANNLAWIYVTSRRNLDDALRLAQAAHQQLPDDPHVNDTLGWIYRQKSLPAQAVPPLEMSVKKDPGNAVVHYHLGMAYLDFGDMDKARKSLEAALKLKPDFDGAAEARKTLSSLGK